MKAAPIEITKAITPVIQVSRRLPRQAAMKNLPHRWMTMKKKKASTDQRCSEFTNRPTLDRCHHTGPSTASTQPVTITRSSALMVSTPNT